MDKQEDTKCWKCGEVKEKFYQGVCHQCHNAEVDKAMKRGSLPIALFRRNDG